MPKLRQICLTPSIRSNELGHPSGVRGPTRIEQRRLFDQSLVRSCPVDQFPAGFLSTGCPYPILVTQGHLERLEEFHVALDLAITSIVERWWSDVDARFPQRMPLEAYEEQVLQVGRLVLSYSWIAGCPPKAID